MPTRLFTLSGIVVVGFNSMDPVTLFSSAVAIMMFLFLRQGQSPLPMPMLRIKNPIFILKFIFMSNISNRKGLYTHLQEAESRRSAALNSDVDQFSPEFQDRARSINATYNGDQIHRSFGDDLANFFGFRSSYDKQKAQLEQNRKEALLQLKTIEAEQGYNSESAKALRMRLAGLNPDLQGLGEASEASEFNEPEAATDLSNLTTGQEVFNDFANAFTTAISIFSGVQGLKQTSLAISKEEIRQAVSGTSDALNLLTSLFSVKDLEDYFDNPTSSVNFSYDTLRKLGIRSPRSLKMITSAVNSVGQSYKGAIHKYNTFSDWLESQERYVGNKSKWFRTGNPDNDTDSDIFVALKSWANFLHDVETYQNKFTKDYYSNVSGVSKANFENALNQYQTDYFRSLDGNSIATSENAAVQYRKYVNDAKERLIRKLTGPDASTFSLILAVQLMGETDIVRNSGVGKLVDLAL